MTDEPGGNLRPLAYGPAVADSWDPGTYHRFRSSRSAPFHDLLALVAPIDGGRAIDLGCGTGELTALLHHHVRASETVGVDSSPSMLAEAAVHAEPAAVRFEEGDLTAVAADRSWDVVLANASLQWVPDHPTVLARLVGALRPGGQLAVQVPANTDHPSHVVATALGREHGVEPPPLAASVLSPVAYSELLHRLGAVDQHVRLQVYGDAMERTDAVVDWVRGTFLTHYRRALGDEMFEGFLVEYRRRLLDALGDPAGARPYFYAFPRILFVARFP